MRRSRQLVMIDLPCLLLFGGFLPPPFFDRQAADAPIFHLDFVDDNKRRVERLVQHIAQQLADTLDERGLLLPRHPLAAGRRALARHLDVHIRHRIASCYQRPACWPPSTCSTSPVTNAALSR